jgi:phospholipase A1
MHCGGIVDHRPALAKQHWPPSRKPRTLDATDWEAMTMRKLWRGFGGSLLGLLITGMADAETLDECLLHAVQSATAATTVGELRELCSQRLAQEQVTEHDIATEQAAASASHAAGIVEKRLALERYSHDNPFVLTPHRPNYLLPLSYTTNPNQQLFRQFGNGELQRSEVEFQLSLKVLVAENLLGDNGHLSFAYTNRSFWQAYNRQISAAFRETNHEPELLFTLENDWNLFGMRNSANQFIFNHQSNGRGAELSRSWNRVMLNSVWEKDNFVLSFEPWYRIPESRKRDATDTEGDDNPDIEKYLGNFELRGMYQVEHGQTISLMLRNNLRSDNYGAFELAYSFPIGDTKLKGYLKYFNGYGQSLIDYNHRTQNFGIGFLISDWL